MCTHFTKLSSSLLFALIGGVVGSSAFLPPSESAAPANVVPRVAMASCYGEIFKSALILLVFYPNSNSVDENDTFFQKACLASLEALFIPFIPTLPVFRRLFRGCLEGERRTTCDPTWRPMIVYIATIFAVLRQLIRSGGGDRCDADASMDGGGEGGWAGAAVARSSVRKRRWRLGGGMWLVRTVAPWLNKTGMWRGGYDVRLRSTP